MLVAGFAVASSAFLVPPHVPEVFKDLRFKGGPPPHVKDFIHALLEGKTTSVDLDCPGCPFAKEQYDSAIVWEENASENAIRLDFATKGGILTLNGQPLLPIEEAQKAQTTTIKAHQISKDTGEKSVEVPLNFAMEVMPPVSSPHKDDISMIPVEFTVLAMNGIPVKVNTVSLKLIETPAKDLVIVNHEEIPFEVTPGAESCETARVWSLCRLKAIVMARLKSMVEKTEDVQEWVKTRCGGRRPHAHPHKHHGHGPHRYHRVGHMLHQTFRFFVIPALLGVIGGLAASAIGMVVGQSIVLLVRFYRRSQGRRPLHLVEREVIIVPVEKDELLAEEGLPEYEEAPLYEHVVQDGAQIEPTLNEKQ